MSAPNGRRVPARPRYSLAQYVRAVRDWLAAIDRGEDPIEAMHGHRCGPDCWHNAMKKKESA